jgi:glycosyltransferase involved in cell wall biosynthesis
LGSGRAVGFAVSTVDFGVARGDLFVATGLGRYLRRSGVEPIYAPPDSWYDLPGELDWVVALLPAFRPSLAPPGPRIVGWARNEVTYWLEHDELELFDAILCSSSLAAAEIGKVYSGPVGVLPIGVDLELFETPQNHAGPRFGVVSTVNQWGRERDVYRALRSAPVTFDLRIHGWARGLHRELVVHHQGLINFFELPSVYWGSRVILDDFNPTTVGWGAVNSRVFEALAAGALPVTNTRLGMAELGLDAVPTYSNPAELNPLVQSLLDDPEGTGMLVEQLQSVVKERHSFENRAEELIALLSELPEKGGSKRVIGFAPDYRAGNPFQEMLYSAGASHGVAAIPIDLDTFIGGRALSRFEHESPVFHLHWTAPIIGSSSSEAEALVRVDEVLKAIDSFKARGGRFVWTVHNVLPHETRFEGMEAHLRQELAERADLVHVMCDGTRDHVAGLYWLPSDRTVTVPHSSYIGMYPDAADRQMSRIQLALRPDDIALLALGGIRPYKGLDRLLVAFDRASRREPRLRLIIAGKPGNFEGLDELENEYRSHPRAVVNFNEILPEDLQYFYKAADVAVLPQRNALNSGALLLAYSFGLPVIAPRVGCLSELLDEDAAIGFEPNADGSLEDALVGAVVLANPRARSAAYSIAVSRPVGAMSSAFLTALDQVKARPNRSEPD